MSSDDSEYEFDDACDIDNQATQVLSGEGGNLVSLVNKLCENDRKINEQCLVVERSLFGDASDNAGGESSTDEPGEDDDDDDDMDWDEDDDKKSSNPFVQECAEETNPDEMAEEERVADFECKKSEPMSSTFSSSVEMSLSNDDDDDDDALEGLMKNGTPFQRRLWRSYKRNKRLNDESKPERRKRDRPDCEAGGQQGVNYSMMPSGVTNRYVGPSPIKHKLVDVPDIDKIEMEEKRKKRLRIEEEKRLKESAELILKEARERANKAETKTAVMLRQRVSVADRWMNNFERLLEHGVRKTVDREKDLSLRNWVNKQRIRYNKGELEEDRIFRLYQVGFVFKLK